MLADDEGHRLLIDLIEKMLDYEPDRRYANDPPTTWLQNFSSWSITRFHSSRITLGAALEHDFFNSLATHQRHEEDPSLKRQYYGK